MVVEIVLSIVIIIALLLFFGVSVQTILTGAVLILIALVVLAIILIAVFFFATDISLLFRKRVKGKFLRIDDSTRFDHAVYDVGGTEYHCIFPAESYGRKRIYHVDQEYTLLIARSEKRKTAYDRHSLITILFGTVFSALLVAVFILIAAYFRSVL
jgi:ABC-type multidrug transport system fused ATPase/permease subunit